MRITPNAGLSSLPGKNYYFELVYEILIYVLDTNMCTCRKYFQYFTVNNVARNIHKMTLCKCVSIFLGAGNDQKLATVMSLRVGIIQSRSLCEQLKSKWNSINLHSTGVDK